MACHTGGMSQKSRPFALSRSGLLAACDEMDDRLRRLIDSKGRVADEIHALRRLGKQLRGALMIAGEPKPCIRSVGFIGSMLGGPRDAVVRLDTWKLLAIEHEVQGSIEGVITALLAQQSKSFARRPPAELVAWGQSIIGGIRMRLESAAPAALEDRCAKGAERMLRRFRKRLKKAINKADDRDFHEVRKSAKAWLGGMTLLEPGAVPPGGDEVRQLGELLGEEHDLQVFAEWLGENGFSPANVPRVWRRISKVQTRTRRASLQLIRRDVVPALKKG